MSASATTDSTPVNRRRAVVASTVGTTIEWYDFFLYGTAAALVFPKLFFPGSSPFAGVLLSFSTLFVGFAARPVGAAIFGHYGDRVGRKTTLVTTLVLMGVATFLIGLLPLVRHHRRRGADPADPPADRPGHRRRRRVGRLRAHVDGVGRAPPQGADGQLAAAGRAARVCSFDGHGPADDRRPEPRGLRQLGLAGALPAQLRPGPHRPLRAAEGAGEPGVPRGQEGATRSSSGRSSRCSRSTRWRSSPRPSSGCPSRPRSTSSSRSCSPTGRRPPDRAGRAAQLHPGGRRGRVHQRPALRLPLGPDRAPPDVRHRDRLHGAVRVPVLRAAQHQGGRTRPRSPSSSR